jgi:phage terminase large subunit-like protein
VVSSAASEAVDLAAAAGFPLDDWQQWCIEGACGERADGTWAAFECGLILPRQNGKNAVLIARELAGIILFGDDLIIHSAHRADTTLEHFRKMVELAEEFNEFGKLVKRVSHVNGHEGIELKGGRRINFVSRARTPGRGFSGSVVVLDEAYDLSPQAIGAMIPTLATRSMAQVWYTSSAPHSDSIVLHALRSRGRKGENAERLFYAEWGNEAGTEIDDEEAIYSANPGMGIRISLDYVESERRLMSGIPGEYLRERLGVAEEPLGDQDGPISLARWAELADPTSSIVGEISTAIDVSPDLKWTTIASAGCRQDGHYHVEIGRRQPGTDWVLQFAKDNPEFGPYRVAGSSPAGFLLPLLAEAGVWAIDVPATEVTQATARLITAVDDGTIHHLGSNEIAAALSNATIAQRGDAQSWSRIKSTGDISALVAATIAVGGMRSDDYEPQIRF